MARVTGGEWQKQVIGAGKKVLHDNSPVAGEYGFWRAKWNIDGVTVVADVYPDFGAVRWLWGVKFPAQSEVRRWNTDTKENEVTRAEQKEWRTGGHASTREEAQAAAEQAVKKGRPVGSPGA